MSEIAGKRIAWSEGQDFVWLKSGEYCKQFGKWYVAVPSPSHENGFGMMAVEEHGWKVEEHEDGTISVTPSILVSGSEGETLWHGYLTKGIWKEC